MSARIKLVLSAILFVIQISTASAQLQFFDSVHTVASSSIYDYRNPTYGSIQWGYDTWLAYERHSGSSSDIVIRRANYSSYGNEIIISNTTGALNLNPTFHENILVWQSNQRGNWDLYYSFRTSDSSWSSPVLLDSSLADETEPYILSNDTDPVQYNFSYLVYKRNNSIRFRRHKTSTNVWSNDTLVTDGIYEDTEAKIFHGGTASSYVVLFLREYSGGMRKLHQRYFYENIQGNPTSWDNISEIYSPNSMEYVTKSATEFITIPYDTLNSRHIVGFLPGGQNFKEIITKSVPGKHIAGKGAPNTIILDNLYYSFSEFSSLAISRDSLYFAFINRPGTFNNNPQHKKIYLGDTNFIPEFDVSIPVFHQAYYKIKTIWERRSGNRIELVESYLLDFLNDIESNVNPAFDFRLAQNFPNPFNPVTFINYTLSVQSFVSLKVYDVLGNEIAVLVNEKKDPGQHVIEFNGKDLASGIYFYRIESRGSMETKKMTLLK